MSSGSVPDAAPPAPDPAPRSPAHPVRRNTDAAGGPVFWIGTAIGMSIAAFGLWGLLQHADQTVPLNWLKFFLGGVILHDLIWAPVIALASYLLVRVVPRPVRPTLQGTLLVTAAVLLVVTPALTGRGRNANNPSILPQDYETQTLKVLGAVWIGGALVAVYRWRRRSAGAGG